MLASRSRGLGGWSASARSVAVDFKIYLVCGTLNERRLIMLLKKYAQQQATTQKVPGLRGD